MSQLDYMEKRGSGLKRICNETKKLESYKSDRMPVFKSTSSQFLTIIYSMEYENRNTMDSLQVETKMGLSWEQVGTRLGLSWDEVEELFVTLQQPTTISDLKTLYGWSNSSKFKAKYVTPLIEAQLVCMRLIRTNRQVLINDTYLQKMENCCLQMRLRQLMLKKMSIVLLEN